VEPAEKPAGMDCWECPECKGDIHTCRCAEGVVI
jgi:hypothetical protein